MEDNLTPQILDVMEELRRVQPSLRFGQLVATVAMQARGPIKSATWDVEDEQFLQAASAFLENLRSIDPQLLAGRTTEKEKDLA